MWISRLVFFRWRWIHSWIIGEAATKFCRLPLWEGSRVFHGGGIGSWELILQHQIKSFKKTISSWSFWTASSCQRSNHLFGSHMRRVQASNSLGCYFFIEVCRCMNSKFHLDHVALHIFMGYPPFKILPPNGGMCFGRASRKHHQTWQDSKSPTLERHLANQTSATLGIFCGGALVIRWWFSWS